MAGKAVYWPTHEGYVDPRFFAEPPLICEINGYQCGLVYCQFQPHHGDRPWRAHRFFDESGFLRLPDSTIPHLHTRVVQPANITVSSVVGQRVLGVRRFNGNYPDAYRAKLALVYAVHHFWKRRMIVLDIIDPLDLPPPVEYREAVVRGPNFYPCSLCKTIRKCTDAMGCLKPLPGVA